LLEFLFWFFVVPSALAAIVSNRAGRNYLEYVESSLREPAGEYTPPVSLIVPVKGVEYALAENLKSLAGQNYPDFELLVVARSASDDALRVVRSTLGPDIRVLVAGEPPDGTGEKVHNLIEAVRLTRAASEVFVFADSDGQVGPDWLRSLVAPLADDALGATTGFRWYFPEEGRFWPLLRSVWDSAIAGNMRPEDKNFAWGGGMAIRRGTFEQAKVVDFWHGTVSDDYRLTAALNAAGPGPRGNWSSRASTAVVSGGPVSWPTSSIAVRC
jgi:cellulose synthase/poly-beta-1,6-N-acetylglucosamine synthase-like glycosyltransferase